MKHLLLSFFISFIFLQTVHSQEEEEGDLEIKNKKKHIAYEFNSLAPAKAAFYSAVLPGLGQAYNKKYWKIPIVYGAIGTSVYIYSRNNKNYNDVLDAIKLEREGKPHQYDNLDLTALESAATNFKKNRDLALFISLGLYVLNILEANVDAHLPDKKIDHDLSFSPNLFISPVTNEITYGASLTFKFN